MINIDVDLFVIVLDHFDNKKIQSSLYQNCKYILF